MLLVLERRGLSLPQLALHLVVEHRPVEEAEHDSQEQEGLENPLLLSGAHPVAHVPGGVPGAPAPHGLAAGSWRRRATRRRHRRPRARAGRRRKEGGTEGGTEGPAERLSPWAPPRRPGRLLRRCGPCAPERGRRDSGRRGAGAPAACCGRGAARCCPAPSGGGPGLIVPVPAAGAGSGAGERGLRGGDGCRLSSGGAFGPAPPRGPARAVAPPPPT